MLMNIGYSIFTNLHQFVCKYPISQYSHIPVYMLATLIASMLIGVMMPTVQTVYAWLAGQIPIILPASSHSGPWNTSTNPDLALVIIDSYSCLPDRHVLEKFPRSQHRPSLIASPRFARSAPSKPVKQWNFR